MQWSFGDAAIWGRSKEADEQIVALEHCTMVRMKANVYRGLYNEHLDTQMNNEKEKEMVKHRETLVEKLSTLKDTDCYKLLNLLPGKATRQNFAGACEQISLDSGKLLCCVAGLLCCCFVVLLFVETNVLRTSLSPSPPTRCTLFFVVVFCLSSGRIHQSNTDGNSSNFYMVAQGSCLVGPVGFQCKGLTYTGASTTNPLHSTTIATAATSTKGEVKEYLMGQFFEEKPFQQFCVKDGTSLFFTSIFNTIC